MNLKWWKRSESQPSVAPVLEPKYVIMRTESMETALQKLYKDQPRVHPMDGIWQKPRPERVVKAIEDYRNFKVLLEASKIEDVES